ncbi:MAG: alcohol dehydrogenase catalytic domain-containing protein [Magnetococcus sp. MYC-9]
MRAVHLSDRLRYVSDHPLPVPLPDEALLRVTLAGICGTDLGILRGYKSFQGILGHELVGVVTASPDPSWLHRRVVAEINCGCGRCPWCRNGRPAHCPQRTVPGILGRDGFFADYCAMPVRNLHLLPEEVSDRAAVFVEPLAAALRITEQVHIRPHESVVLVGDGRLGLLVAQVLALTGCRLQVVGRHPENWSILHDRGMQVCLDTEVAAEGQAETVVECSGSAAGFQLALRLLRPGGRLVLKSTFHGTLPIPLADCVVQEFQWIGSRCGPFAPAIRLLQQQRIEVEPLITACYPLPEALAALAHAGQRGALKILLQP